MKAATLETTHGCLVGDIFYASWGYDQTNVDWYQVVGVTRANIKVKPIGSWIVDGRVMPAVDEFLDAEAAPVTKRVRTYDHGNGPTKAFTLNSYSSAQGWDGTSKYDTYAAGGMGH